MLCVQAGIDKSMKHGLALLSILAFSALVSVPTLAREARSSNDASFVRQAHHADLLEEQSAKVALKQVSGADARAVAHTILKQDQTSEQILRQATHVSGLTQPKAQNVEAPRPAWPYFAQTVAEQRIMVNLFREEAQHGGKPALRVYAETRLPLIQGELVAVERDERRAAGIVPANKPYILPKPGPSITPMEIPWSTTTTPSEDD